MRTVTSLILLCVQLPALAAEPAQTRPSSKATCESRDLTFDSKEISCSLRAFASAQRLRLTVNFSGGHDDTNATMTVYLDDKPFACDGGSKLRLMGEDGDVGLSCLFSVGAASPDQQLLKSVVKWSHAEYASFSLDAD